MTTNHHGTESEEGKTKSNPMAVPASIFRKPIPIEELQLLMDEPPVELHDLYEPLPLAARKKKKQTRTTPQEQRAQGQSAGEQSTVEQSGGEQSTGEQNIGGPGAGKRSAGEQIAEEQNAVEQGAEDRSAQKESSSQQGQPSPDPSPIPDSICAYIAKLESDVGYKVSFDIVLREMTFCNKKTALFFMNGFAKDEILTEVLTRLTYLQTDDLTTDVFESFLKLYVPAIQVAVETDWDNMVTNVLSGGTALYVDGEPKVLLIDAKTFPARGPEEPSLERVVRGSRDGFVETLLVNITLVRRRLRDKNLRYEILRVGERTQTDLCIAYIKDIVDEQLLEAIRDKISQVKIDGLPLADKQLEEATVKRGWSPFPLVRYSERPDVVAAHLMEGHVAVFVDTTPSVMILPTTFFDHIQHAEENRQTPFIGTYLRWVRFIGIFASLFLLPLWFLFTLEPELKPQMLSFIGAEKQSRLPLVAQFITAEIGVDLMRLAAVHTPAPLVAAMSIISAILIGDIAVKTGLFVNEVILYMAVAAIGMFATPSYELGLANRIVRLVLIIAVALFRVPGFMLVTMVLMIMLITERSFNRPYFWPFIPFDLKAMLNLIVRPPVLQNRLRPNLLKPKQMDKMPNEKN